MQLPPFELERNFARYEFAADALASVGIGAEARGLDAFCGNGYGTHWLASR